ncbi:MAG: dephospho-CoA kinase [Pseudomonadota bacterium]
MILVGLTGSIGMGKSTTAEMFADRGVPVYDADAAVHRLYQPGGAAVAPLEAAFPGIIDEDGGVDRAVLRDRVLDDKDAMARLEGIVHPLVGQMQLSFLANAREGGADMVVLDIPLLFENGGEKRVDIVVVVSASAEVQRTRVLAREGMTEDAFEAILKKQTPDSEKRARADYVIDTGQGLDHAAAQVDAVIEAVRDNRGQA